MPVIGAVLHLEQIDSPALASLAADPRVDLGPAQGTKLPVVVSTDSRQEDKDVWRFIENLPGVLHIELAFAEFSDLVNPSGIEVTP